MNKHDERSWTQSEEGSLQRYKAPALEKGLDILELVASEPGPVTAAEIVRKLDRSHGELFRMIQVLEFRGYLERSADNEGYRLTDKLFALGMAQPRIKGLVEIALPKMRDLSEASGQSCHLVVHSQGHIVVVARMESSEEIGFSVRVGHRRAVVGSVSGLVLYAFQTEQLRKRWDAWLADQFKEVSQTEFERQLLRARKNGYISAKSSIVPAITDIAAPIWRGEYAVAALAVPFFESTRMQKSMDESISLLKSAAAEISGQLVASDTRV